MVFLCLSLALYTHTDTQTLHTVRVFLLFFLLQDLKCSQIDVCEWVEVSVRVLVSVRVFSMSDDLTLAQGILSFQQRFATSILICNKKTLLIKKQTDCLCAARRL